MCRHNPGLSIKLSAWMIDRSVFSGLTNKQTSKKHSTENGEIQGMDWKSVNKQPVSKEKLWAFKRTNKKNTTKSGSVAAKYEKPYGGTQNFGALLDVTVVSTNKVIVRVYISFILQFISKYFLKVFCCNLRGMIPWLTSSSLLLLCCNFSWRTEHQDASQ